ncbi:ABC transporter permease [Conexibacter woesei]|uniref:ABC transporter permease n=1 Tax=Conexibacter woesei TaxID=191495 RepID=UPI00042A62F5|nr:ABC transporter permease [Conexibacter woesei]
MSLSAVAAPSLALARRSLRNALRRPQFLAPLVLMPTLFLAINTGGLTRSTDLPGFPDVGFFDFQLAGAITQSLLLGGVMQGIATALEIESGFFDRLVASPIPRVAIVLGRVLAGAVIAAAQVVWFLVLGLVFGASIQGGVPGALLVVLIGALTGMGCAGLGVLIAFRAKNASTVQGIFPLVFVVVFISSAFFPRALLSHPADWFADYNPLSYVADGMRDPIISGISARPVLEGLATGAALGAVFAALAVLALRGKLAKG